MAFEVGAPQPPPQLPVDIEMVVDDLVTRRLLRDGESTGLGSSEEGASTLFDCWATDRGLEWLKWITAI